MKRIFLFILTLIAGLVLFVWIFNISGPREILAKISLVSPIQFVVLFSISFLCLLIMLARWSSILKAQGYRLTLRDLMAAKLAETSVSFLTPVLYVGGEGVRAFIIKKNADVPMVKGLATILIDRVSELIAIILFFLFAFIYLIISGSPLIGVLTSIALLILLLAVIAVFFYLKLFSFERFLLGLARIFHLGGKSKLKDKKSAVGAKLKDFKETIVNFFKAYPKVFLQNIVFSIVIIILTIVQFRLILVCLGYDINWNEAVLVRVITAALSFVPIPGSLGTYEGGTVLAFRSMGIGPDGGMSFCLLVRALQAIMVILGLICIFNFAVNMIFKLFLKGNKKG